MQKNHFILLYMVLSIHSNLQLANDILPRKNKSTQPSHDSINLEQSLIKPSVLPTPASFELSPSISIASKEQSLDLFSYFLRPINFSKEGITYYFTYTYNHEKYTEYLPYNFSHMLEFLEFGHNNNQTQAYAKSIIKLFLQKIKGCDFINSYSLITAMPKLADALEPYIVKKEATFLQELQKSIKARLSNIFSTYYAYFQKNPDAFLEALAEQIAKKTNEVQTQQHIDIEHIKKDIVRFLEICINKLIWSSKDPYDAWIAINDLATQAENFLDKKLLSDVDALDDIYWSLIHRFCYFIDIAAEDFSQEVFIQIIQDIHKEKLILFEMSEQEDLIMSKKDFLLRKIKNYCPYVYQPISKDNTIYEAQNTVGVTLHTQ